MSYESLITRGLPSTAMQRLYPSLESLPKPSFYDELPRSASEALSRADQSQGSGETGKSMGHVSVGITMVPFGGSYSFVRTPTDGQLVFSNPRRELFGNELAVISIDSLNALLKQSWQSGIVALSTKSDLYTQSQITILKRIHTRYWSKLNFVADKRTTAKTDADIGISYLALELFADNYLRAGWVRGVQQQTGYEQATTIRTSGTVESVENIWGDGILCGDRLFLILRRVFDDKTKEWAQFAYIPWAGRGVDPSFADTAYISYSGHQCTGRVYYIGTVETWMEETKINDALLSGYLSLSSSIVMGPRERQPSCLRITYNGRPHTALTNLLY